MSKRVDNKIEIIQSFIENYNLKYNDRPSLQDIADGTQIPKTSVHRYLLQMDREGRLSYQNGSVATARMQKEMETVPIPILGRVSCGRGETEEEEVIDYLRLPKSLLGSGDFFALVAKGDSMIDAGIYAGDYVIVHRQEEAYDGDYVVALNNGLSNLKKLRKTESEVVLVSCNSDKTAFPDIPASDLRIQGVAVGTFHMLDNPKRKGR